MYVLYYASMLRCWHLVWILVRIDHPCLGVGCHAGLYSADTRCHSPGLYDQSPRSGSRPPWHCQQDGTAAPQWCAECHATAGIGDEHSVLCTSNHCGGGADRGCLPHPCEPSTSGWSSPRSSTMRLECPQWQTDSMSTGQWVSCE
jgi:hypothetical protein